jgi:amidase
MSTEILECTAMEQARRIASRQISCVELTRLYLDRIDRLNPRLQAFVEVFRREALLTAHAKDAWLKAGRPLPPFHGVPIGIKDLNLVRGRRTRFGSAAMIPFISPIDDATVAGLRRAGFVILGKLATSELGAIPITEPDIHPPTRNPWNPDHTPGGSSGGSAAAVAARLVPVAHGSDGGGSIRIPASFTGLVGLKPARGRLRNQFGIPDRQILYTCGALARTVGEAAAMLDLMSGVTAGKPHWATPPAQPFSELMHRRPGALKIRFTIDSQIVKAHPDVKDAILSTAKLLEDLGHHVEEVACPEGRVEEFISLWGLAMSRFPLPRGRLVQPITRWLREEGRHLKARDVSEHHRVLEARLLNWFEGADLWLTPTSAVLPPRVGSFPQDKDPKGTFFKVAEIGAFTALCNVTGQPAISIPAGLSKEGLPIGAHLVGPIQGESLLLQVAKQIEEARPWKDRAPAML